MKARNTAILSFWDNSLATPVPSSGATGQADPHGLTRANHLSYSENYENCPSGPDLKSDLMANLRAKDRQKNSSISETIKEAPSILMNAIAIMHHKRSPGTIMEP
ncbi:MAG: hypothetical protein U9R17_01235 [Thermodesulfobacteriota bacterium]|nr:hypothetical protein [Thermodesulfobacteriota bacterium]